MQQSHDKKRKKDKSNQNKSHLGHHTKLCFLGRSFTVLLMACFLDMAHRNIKDDG